MESVNKSLKEVIDCIKDSKEYKNCLLLKEKMNSNEEILKLIEKVKDYQKKYVKSNYDENIKVELEKLMKQLNDIPLYSIYIQNLELVNEKIDYVRDELNDYFYQLFNNIEK